MARWQESYNVGDTVEYNVPACGWHRGRIVRKTRSGIPVVKCTDRSIWVATRKTDIRRVAGPIERAVLRALDEADHG